MLPAACREHNFDSSGMAALLEHYTEHPGMVVGIVAAVDAVGRETKAVGVQASIVAYMGSQEVVDSHQNCRGRSVADSSGTVSLVCKRRCEE